MGRFDMDEEQVAISGRCSSTPHSRSWPSRLRRRGTFRRGGAASKMITSKAGLGGLVYAGLSLRNKKKADGGLPERVLIAATRDKVHVYKLKIGREYSTSNKVPF